MMMLLSHICESFMRWLTVVRDLMTSFRLFKYYKLGKGEKGVIYKKEVKN